MDRVKLQAKIDALERQQQNAIQARQNHLNAAEKQLQVALQCEGGLRALRELVGEQAREEDAAKQLAERNGVAHEGAPVVD